MKSKIYYGEYSLEHWIKLMVTGNVVCPEYQRSFVWDKEDVIRLINSLNEGSFVQPVTIALNRKDDRTTENIILDGQQRLTAILLARINRMPNNFNQRNVQIDEQNSDEDEGDNKKEIVWDFSKLLYDDNKKLYNDIKKIKERAQNDDRYEDLNIDFGDKGIDKFYEDTFLGFSYIVLDNESMEGARKYFAMLFRNINYWGKKLNAVDSRRSLYYMNLRFCDYFDGITEDGGDVLCDIKIKERMNEAQIDFVRYLSVLSQYFASENSTDIMKRYSSYRSRETFYVDYVSYVLGLEQEGNTDKFNGFNFEEVFPNECWKERFIRIHDNLQNHMAKMGLDNKVFPSCIDADYWLFGLIYWVLFKGKEISFNDELFQEVHNAINEKKGEGEEGSAYTRDPNALKYLRERIAASIDIYKKYANV